jgi:TonB family protein
MTRGIHAFAAGAVAMVGLASLDRVAATPLQVPEPLAVYRAWPEYAHRSLSGSVGLRMTIGRDGEVERAQVADPFRMGNAFQRAAFDRAALRAARAWRFTPALVGGERVRSWTSIRFHFESFPEGLDCARGRHRPYPVADRQPVVDDGPREMSRSSGGWARNPPASGNVQLHVLVCEHGRPINAVAVKSVSPDDDSWERAVSRWIYRPALKSGRPVAGWVDVPLLIERVGPEQLAPRIL